MDMKKHEAIYKKVDGIEIGATVICSEHFNGPVLILIHGGALIFGDREGALKKPEVELFLEAGFCAVVSVDYRLAPESKLPDIINDLVDAWQWVNDGANGLLPGKELDYCLMGHSAGGYLSQLMAVKLPKKPKAVFSFYGYCNIIGDWYTKPSAYYCEQPEISERDAFSYVYKHSMLSQGDDINKRWIFYMYLRQKGLWVDYVTGIEFHDSPISAFDQFCPIVLADKNYPPIFLAHGTNDTDVPFEQSAIMKIKMDKLNIPNFFHVVEKGGHSFDSDQNWKNSENSRSMNNELFKFINKYVK